MGRYKIVIVNDEGDDIELEKNLLTKAAKEYRDEVELRYVPAAEDLQVRKETSDADGIISVYTYFGQEEIERLKNCKIIATQTIGVNTIDLKAATEKGIAVTNVPDYCIEEVASHTVAMALACSRNLLRLDHMAREKRWDIEEVYQERKLHRLAGKNYGLVSFGHIAKRVAEIVKGLGMQIFAYDPYQDREAMAHFGAKKVETLEELLRLSDVVSVHTPLTKATQGMFGLEQFRMMKKDAIFINAARGEVVKEEQLAQALQEGCIAAAATDVITDERKFESCLYDLKNVVISPHVAYYTEEAVKECRWKAAEQIAQVLFEKRMPQYLVNRELY